MFRDGRGQALCCYSNGCNRLLVTGRYFTSGKLFNSKLRDLELAMSSLSYISNPLDVGEVEILKQRASDIQRYRLSSQQCVNLSNFSILRLNQFEQSKMTAPVSLGRSGVSRLTKNTGGEDTISCFKCNIMTSNYQVSCLSRH